jgi:two-component system, NarL family, sensor kinase
MSYQFQNVSSLNSQALHPDAQRRPHPVILSLVVGLFGLVALLELVTSVDAVFSYLYVGPILLANLRLNRRIAIQLTILASALTIFNLWIPGSDHLTTVTIENRFIAVCALIVTEVLSHRNRYFEETIAQHKARLQFQNKLTSIREDFVSTLTHDLKTPLLGAIEMIKALQQERFGSITPQQHKVLATMARSHQSNLQLLETLLDVYRNDAEGVQLARSPIHLVDLVEQVIESLKDLATNYHVSLNLSCHEASIRHINLNGDALQLQRVISNLCMNAINHSPIDGRVDVVVDTWGDRTHPQQVVKVMDEGPGIQPDELPQLFERFYQGQSDRQAKGSGLGLYLSRQIVEAHGGTIWAENRVSRGAIFGFRLPIRST